LRRDNARQHVLFPEELFTSQLRLRIFNVKTCKPLELSVENGYVALERRLRALILINKKDTYCDAELGKSRGRERSQGTSTKCFRVTTASRHTNKRVPKFKADAICRLALSPSLSLSLPLSPSLSLSLPLSPSLSLSLSLSLSRLSSALRAATLASRDKRVRDFVAQRNGTHGAPTTTFGGRYTSFLLQKG
jgi:hypothetical protein